MPQAIAAFIIAFGARVSDAPHIIGRLGPSRSSLPALRGEDLSAYGRARQDACLQLAEQATRFADQAGLYRQSNPEAFGALMLASHLAQRVYFFFGHPLLCLSPLLND